MTKTKQLVPLYRLIAELSDMAPKKTVTLDLFLHYVDNVNDPVFRIPDADEGVTIKALFQQAGLATYTERVADYEQKMKAFIDDHQFKEVATIANILAKEVADPTASSDLIYDKAMGKMLYSRQLQRKLATTFY